MKKVSIFAVALVGVFAMSSCKKDYTCSCTYTSSDGSTVVEESYDYGDQKKSDAEDACDAQVTVLTATGFQNVECSLD